MIFRAFAAAAAAGIASFANAGVFIEFAGLMTGNYEGEAEGWRWMAGDNYAWEWFEDCDFTATSSNAGFLEGRDLAKLTLKSGMGVLAPAVLTGFRKTGALSDHRLYTEGEFEIAYDGAPVSTGSCDIEVDVQYVPSVTSGAINGHFDALFAGPQLNGADLASAFNGEHDNNQWRATILTMSWVFGRTFATTIRLESQPEARCVAVAAPQAFEPVALETVGAAFEFGAIADAGGGAVSVVERQGAPGGELPAGLDALSFGSYWSIDSSLVSFATALSLRYDTNLVRRADRLCVYRREDASAPWQLVPVAAVTNGAAVVTNVTHFSEWLVGEAASDDPVLPLDLPGTVSEADRQLYLDWIATNRAAWGTADFGATPARDFLASWIVGRMPAAGRADSLALAITAFEPLVGQPAEASGRPVAWCVEPSARPDLVRVKLRLEMAGVPWSGPINGNVVIQCAGAAAGPWAGAVGQADSEARLSFAEGEADLVFNRPSGATFFRPVLSREGRAGPAGRVSPWGSGTTNQWLLCTVDNTPTNGLHASLAFSARGVLGIGYYDETARDLKYASYAGGELRIERVDTAGDVGQYCSLAFSPEGLPAISYYDATQTHLKYAAFDGTNWLVRTVDTNAYAGLYSSLAFNTNGYPAVSYQGMRSYNDVLMYAEYKGGAWTNVVVDAGNYRGYYTCLAFASGRPRIAYYEDDNYYVRYAEFSGASWSTQTTYLRYADDLSLTFTTNGYPAVALYDFLNRKVIYSAKGVYGWGTSSEVETLNMGATSGYVSLANTPAGEPAIAYYDDVTDDLKYAVLRSGTWVRTTVDSAGSVGLHVSLGFSAHGRPTIAYFDKTNGKLKVAEYVPVMRVNE
jgi:hypothetical protein